MIVQKHKKEGQKQVNLFLPFLFAASIGAALPIGARLCPDCTIYVRQVTAGDHVALPRGRLRPDCTICVRQVAAGDHAALPRGAYVPQVPRSACDKSLWEASHCSREALTPRLHDLRATRRCGRPRTAPAGALICPRCHDLRATSRCGRPRTAPAGRTIGTVSALI